MLRWLVLGSLALLSCGCHAAAERLANFPDCPSGTTFSGNEADTALGCYRAGVPEGPFVFFDDDGNVQAKALFKGGKLNGVFTYYYPNGRVKFQTNIVNGKFEGRLVEWHENGMVEKIATHRHDVLNGPYEERRVDGSLAMRGQFEDGFQDGEWTFFPKSGARPVTEYYRRGLLTKVIVGSRSVQ